MVARSRLAVLLLCVLGSACHRGSPSAVLDPAVAACIPAGTTLLAGADLDALRASPLYRSLSPGTAALAEPLRGASLLVVAANGTSLTAIVRGKFTEPPSGFTAIGPGLAVSGACRASTVAAPPIVAYAESLAANPVWAVALRAATLPLSGNLANLNNFVHSADHTAVAGRLGDRLSIEVHSVCRTADEAQHLESSLRALISLAGMRSRTLGEIRLDRQNLTVRVTLSADASAAEQLLR